MSTLLYRSSFVTFQKIVYLEIESLGYRTHVSFLHNDKVFLQNGCTNLCSHQQRMRVPINSPTLTFSQLFNFGQPGECAMASPWDFDLYFSDYQCDWTSFHKHDDDFYFLLWGAILICRIFHCIISILILFLILSK